MIESRRVCVVLLAAGLAALPHCRGEASRDDSEAGSSASPGAAESRPSTLPVHPPTAAHPGAGAPGGPGRVGETGPPAGDLAWSVPDGWTEETPSSAMRRAQYRLPPAGGDTESGECVVYYFGPGQGGEVRANIDRWVSQFAGPGGAPPAPSVSEVRIGERAATRVEVKGTYKPSPMAMGTGPEPPARPGYALLGAIVPGGDANWFFKCTGPERTMAANRERFDRLIASIRSGA